MGVTTGGQKLAVLIKSPWPPTDRLTCGWLQQVERKPPVQRMADTLTSLMSSRRRGHVRVVVASHLYYRYRPPKSCKRTLKFFVRVRSCSYPIIIGRSPGPATFGPPFPNGIVWPNGSEEL